ncbi:hypothetical protein KO505_01640 [Psychrosphaera sp. F3M07]|uniref:hypothetical protein n=1 Tax=Psychrosphaera sp. F3M07 TaxID=2841560 RepID=UPI001C08D692|nr:hypothetical protein [Psychrosphaera sp. F3M07]MBU2916661.1 hypothetical protein [Psychrosphaera sp. F3M07]
MNRNQILDDYFLISINPDKRVSAYQLLSQTGVLFSSNLSHRLAITDIQTQPVSNNSTYLFLKVNAEIHDISSFQNNLIESLEAVGSFSQIYQCLINQFYTFCNVNGLKVFMYEEAPNA